jgi:hypothetical protein
MLLPTSLRYSLAVRAIEGKLTVEDIQQSTKQKLEEDRSISGNSVLYCACWHSSIDVIEAILDKGVDVNVKSRGLVSNIYISQPITTYSCTTQILTLIHVFPNFRLK